MFGSFLRQMHRHLGQNQYLENLNCTFLANATWIENRAERNERWALPPVHLDAEL